MDLPHPQLTIQVFDDNDNMVVKVSDNGLGIPDHLSVIYLNPFLLRNQKIKVQV